MIPAFRVRPARAGDLPAVWLLARRLDSYNLPADRRFLARLVDESIRSFRGELPNARARYLFVIERWRDHRVLGCSLIIAKHGTPRRPHLRLDRVTIRGRRALRFGVTTNGPTEVGGLIVAPPFRGHPAHLGRQLSYARFAYMATHPDRFERRVLAEFLPPLTRAGDSRLWQVLGGPRTGLSYREADRRSATDTSFILRAFPRTPIWIDMWPPAVRRDLGQVHPAARGACRLLQAIGFRDLHQVEPFDGGPYYGARLADLTVVRRMRTGRLAVPPAVPPGTVPFGNRSGYRRREPGAGVGLLWTEPVRGAFRAVAARYHQRGDQVVVSANIMQLLDSQPGMRVHVTPL